MDAEGRLARILALIPAALIGLGGGAWNLVKALPSLLALLREVMGAIHDVENYVERRQKVKELQEAMALARKGDLSKLNSMFGGGDVPPTDS